MIDTSRARAALAVGMIGSQLCACAALPTVNYHTLSAEPRQGAWTPFRLTDSTVVLGAPAGVKDAAAFSPDDAKGERFVPPLSLTPGPITCTAQGCAPVAIAVAPTSFEGAVLALEPVSRRLVSTTLSPAYVENSLRLKTLTIEAKDHRVEAINTIGALAASAATIAATVRSTSNPTVFDAPKPEPVILHVPVTIDLADARCEGADPAGCVPAIAADPARPRAAFATRALAGNPGWTYAFEFLDNPRAEGFLPRADLGGVHSAMVSSTCRPLRVRLVWKDASIPPVVLETSAADPDWLVTVPFPAKGAMVFHSLCGIDVQPQAVTEVGVDAMATAFFNNVKAVRAAAGR